MEFSHKNRYYLCDQKLPIGRRWRGKWRVRDQAELIKWLADRYPEIKEQVDYDYYARHCAALEKSEKIKKARIVNLPFEPKLPPYQHQKKALAFVLNLPAAALFMEPGTGKTYVALVATEQRLRHEQINRCLVIAPSSTLETGWAEDVEKFTDLDYAVVRDTETLLEEKDLYIASIHFVNYHIEKFQKKGFDMVVLDESTMIKNPDGKFFKSARKLGDQSKYRIILTGTPMPNGLEGIWSQMMFLDNCLDETIGLFRSRYFWQHPTMHYIYNEKSGSTDKVLDRIKERCLYIKKQDCLDLPERVTVVRKVDPTPSIKKHYKEFKQHLFTRLKSGEEIMAFNPLTELLRLHQILHGHSGSGDETVEIDRPRKLKELSDIINSTPNKVVVWAVYRQDFKWIAEQHDCSVLNGATKDKTKEIKKFLAPDGPKIMLAHPDSAKFGHTWNNADTTVFYSFNYNLESFLQARDRNYRLGQDKKVTEYMLSSGGIDDKILNALRNKRNFSEEAMENLVDFLETL